MSCWSDIRRGDDITQQSALSGTVTDYRCTRGLSGRLGQPEVDTDTMPSCHTEQPILLPAEATEHPVLHSLLSWPEFYFLT